MAKMFYTMDEAKAALGKNEEEIKQFAREGRLREFRDGARLMFKADQVEALKGELGAGGGGEGLDQISLPAESGAPIGLVDSRGASGTGSGIALVDSDAGGVSLSPKDDTSLAADLGMTGSMGGIPSPGKTGTGIGLVGSASGGSALGGTAAGGTAMGGSAAGIPTKGATGITIFGQDEAEKADPSAQTAISSGLQDQVNLEGVGSGSGLLDLTRESDDTSLGALEMDDAGATKAPKRAAASVAPGETGAVLSAVSESAISPGRGGVISQPTYVEASDSMAPAFGGMALGATAVILFGGFVLCASMMGLMPEPVKWLNEKGFPLIAAFTLVPVILGFLGGLIAGKASGR